MIALGRSPLAAWVSIFAPATSMLSTASQPVGCVGFNPCGRGSYKCVRGRSPLAAEKFIFAGADGIRPCNLGSLGNPKLVGIKFVKYEGTPIPPESGLDFMAFHLQSHG